MSPQNHFQSEHLQVFYLLFLVGDALREELERFDDV